MTGTELKALRIELGISVAEAARQLGISARSINRWESDERPIPDNAVALIHTLKRVDVHD